MLRISTLRGFICNTVKTTIGICRLIATKLFFISMTLIAFHTAIYKTTNPDMITDAFPVVISNPGLTPKSGAQFAGAPYANSVAGMPIAADNWLITPELSGKAQTIKFYAFNVTVVDEWGNVLPYNEAFDVLSSKTGTKTSDFKLINSYKAHVWGLMLLNCVPIKTSISLLSSLISSL